MSNEIKKEALDILNRWNNDPEKLRQLNVYSVYDISIYICDMLDRNPKLRSIVSKLNYYKSKVEKINNKFNIVFKHANNTIHTIEIPNKNINLIVKTFN